jgi:hypothetical protein
MLSRNPFFKTMPRTREYTREDAMRDAELRAVRDKYSPNNTATRLLMGDPKFGFKTMLSGESKPLPTAPAVVGGNVDWSQKAVNPFTGFLHGEISKARPMMPLPAMGTKMFMKEPNGNSIHTNF